MSEIETLVVGASVIGTSHQKIGLPCQDYNGYDVFEISDSKIYKNRFIIAIVSDGAGSAQYSDEGSKLVCHYFLDKIKSHLEESKDLTKITKIFIHNLLKGANNEISLKAQEFQSTPRHFACTLLGIVIGVNCAVFFQVGDGAIVAKHKDDHNFNYIFWPHYDEYINSTQFITDDAVIKNEKFINYRIENIAFDEIAIFSDGIQHLVLDYSQKSIHQAFFEDIFKTLKNLKSQKIHPEKIKEKIKKYLNSNLINQKTDDDKTLVLIYYKDINED